VDFSEQGGQSWTNAQVAEMDIQLPFARQDVVLQIEASPFIVPDLVNAQQIFIFLGGLFSGFCSLTAYSSVSFPVNRSFVSGRTARMSLVLPNAVSPMTIGISEDERILGIYLSSITFRTNG